MVGIKEHFVGRLNYNGFEFPPAIKANMAIRPVKDSSGRYTKYSSYLLTVECVIHENVDEFRFNTGLPGFEANPNKIFLDNIPAPKTGSIDGYTASAVGNTAFGMVALRRLLLEQGKRLIFTDKGVGWDFDIDGVRGDILYGPIPHLITWEPLGSAKAVRLVWSVEVTIADCLVVKAPWGDVAEYSTDLEWSISPEGLTRRTITGTIEVPQRVFPFTRLRQGGSADAARELFVPPCPPGFRRIVNRYSLARTRNILNFQITDEEYPSDNPYFKGIVDAQVNANVRNPQPINMAIWHVTIDGTITVSKSHPRYFAWIAFLSVVYARLDAAVRHSKFIDNSEAVKSPGESDEPGQFSAAVRKALQHVIIRSLSITEQVFGRGMSFSMTWEIHPDLESMIKASGLWVPNSEVLDTGQKSSGESTWEKHQVSMNAPTGIPSLAAPWGPRGTAGMEHRTELTMDYIRNLCDVGRIGISLGTHFRPTHRLGEPIFKSRCRVDYYDLYQDVWTIENPQSMRLAPLGGQTPVHDAEVVDSTVKGPAPGPEAFATIPGGGVGVSDDGGLLQPIVQTRGHTQVLVVFTGYVRRCGRPPVMWRLQEYGGAKVVRQIGLAQWKSVVAVKADANGVPHWYGEWFVKYQLDRPPNGTAIVSSPGDLGFPP